MVPLVQPLVCVLFELHTRLASYEHERASVVKDEEKELNKKNSLNLIAMFP